MMLTSTENPRPTVLIICADYVQSELKVEIPVRGSYFGKPHCEVRYYNGAGCTGC